MRLVSVLVAATVAAWSSRAPAVQLSTVQPADPPGSGAAFGNQHAAAIAAGGGGYVAVWIDGSATETVRLSRVSSTGVPTDYPPLQVSSAGLMLSPGVGYDGKRFLVTWQAPSAIAANGYDIWGAYFDATTGNLAAPFTIAGGPGQQANPVVIGGSTSALVAWEDTTPQATIIDQTGTQLPAFPLDSSTAAAGISGAFGGGTYFVTWHENPGPKVQSLIVSQTGTKGAVTQVSDGSNGQDAAVAFDGTNFFVVWGTNGGSTLRARGMKTDGTVVSTPFQIVDRGFDTAADAQVTIVGGHAAVIFTDYDEFGSPELWATRIKISDSSLPDGTAGIAITTVPYLSFLPLPHALTNSRRQVITNDGTNVMAVWGGLEYKGFVSENVYTLKFDPSVALTPQPPVLLSRSANYQLGSVVAGNGSEFLIVWEDDRNLDITGIDLYGLRVGLDGMPIDTAPFIITNAPGDQFLPSVAAGPGGAFLVAWSDEQGLPTSVDLYAARVPATGAAGAPFPVSQGVAGHLAPTVAASPSGFLVAWEDWRAGIGTPLTGVWAHLVSSAGSPTGSDFAIAQPTGDEATTTCAARATWNGTRYFIAYEKPCRQMRAVYSQTNPDNNILGTWVSGSGVVGNNITIAALAGPESMPAVAGDASGKVTVAWRDQTQPTETILASVLDDNATSAGAPVTIANGTGTRQAPAVTATSDGHLVLSWIDGNPASVKARLANSGLATLGDAFVVTNSTPFTVTDAITVIPNPGGGALAGTPRVTPAAQIAVSTTGEALIAWTEVDAFGDENLPRAFYRKLGALPNGATCGNAGGCSDGFCTNGACCNAPCDGICQACGASGCVETPATDTRCSSGTASCEALSTSCRTYNNSPLTSCVAFGQCGDPGSLSDCTVFTDKADGTACETAGCTSGSCTGGACVCPYTLPTFPARALPSGCSTMPGSDGIFVVLALLALLLLWRRGAVS